jgi:hypothetical protein
MKSKVLGCEKKLSRNQSYFTTGGLPPINSFWRQTLETHDQRFFSMEPLQSYSLCNVLSNEKMGLCPMNRLCLCQAYVSHLCRRPYWSHSRWSLHSAAVPTDASPASLLSCVPRLADPLLVVNAVSR